MYSFNSGCNYCQLFCSLLLLRCHTEYDRAFISLICGKLYDADTRCFLTPGKPKPEVTWMKGDYPISSSRRDPRVSQSWDAKHEHCVLSIKDAHFDDAGEYTVKVSNNKTVITTTVTVHVSAPTKDEFTNGINGPDDEDQSVSTKHADSGVVNALAADESDLESDTSFMTDVTSDMTIDISADETDDILPTFDDLPIRSSTKGSSTREETISEMDELEIAVPIGINLSPATAGLARGGSSSAGSASEKTGKKRPTPAIPSLPEELPTRSRTPHFEIEPRSQAMKEGEGVRLTCKVTGRLPKTIFYFTYVVLLWFQLL